MLTTVGVTPTKNIFFEKGKTMLKNTEETYGSVSKIFHWGIFILVALMLIVGFFMEDFPESIQGSTYMLHKSTGLLILGLMVLRLIWHWVNKVPVLPSSMSTAQRFVARFVHWLFYIILLAMPLNGWIMSTAGGRIPTFYGLFSLPFPGIEASEALANQLANLHEIFAYVLLFLILGHTIAALVHHYIYKDNILSRMMPHHKSQM
jgi:cytochrome b561